MKMKVGNYYKVISLDFAGRGCIPDKTLGMVGRLTKQSGGLIPYSLSFGNGFCWSLPKEALALATVADHLAMAQKARAEIRQENEPILKRSLTIGSDPEFCFTKNGSFYHAEYVFGGADTMSHFGTDSCSAIGELRPTYATNPLRHAENIYKLLAATYKEQKSQFADLALVPASIERPTGGHIHLGGVPQSYFPAVLANLDQLLALPATLADPQPTAHKRIIGSGYGRLSDYRRQAIDRIEYRPLSSWLASRQTAEAVLATAFTVAEATRSQKIKLEPPDNFLKNCYTHRYFQPIQTRVKVNREIIEGLPLFNKYRHQINYLYNAAQAEKDIFAGDILEGWGIRKKQPETPPRDFVRTWLGLFQSSIVVFYSSFSTFLSTARVYRGREKDHTTQRLASAVNAACKENGIVAPAEPILLLGLRKEGRAKNTIIFSADFDLGQSNLYRLRMIAPGIDFDQAKTSPHRKTVFFPSYLRQYQPRKCLLILTFLALQLHDQPQTRFIPRRYLFTKKDLRGFRV